MSDKIGVANHLSQLFYHIGSSVQESLKPDREIFLNEESVDFMVTTWSSSLKNAQLMK